MGSSGSRPVVPVQTADNSRRKKKKLETILAPVLRSMNCGTSSLERTQSFARQKRMDYAASADTQENLSDDSGSACGFQGLSGEIIHNQLSGDNNLTNQRSLETSVSIQNEKAEADNLEADGNSDFVLHNRGIEVKNSQQDVKRFCEHPSLRINTRASKKEASVSEVESHKTLFTTKQNDVEPSTSEYFSGSSVADMPSSDASSSTYHPESEVVSSSTLRAEVVTDSLTENSGVHDYHNIRRFPIEDLPSSMSSGEVSGRELRRNNRRRLWETLTNARRRRLSPTYGDVSGMSSWNSSWGLFGWDSNEEINFGDERNLFLRRNREVDERRLRSRQQLLELENIDNALQGGTGHSPYCAFGRHPNGHCACEAFATAEETSTRASISRIVMLAEALFEVLDEIHRQSVALSRSSSISMVSSPAPETIVDSFPVRVHKKNKKSDGSTSNCDECYICLIEYIDGDQIRTLPCSHEFHMTCVDKWLKEIHRVCPLCRGNVCNSNLSNSLPASA